MMRLFICSYMILLVSLIAQDLDMPHGDRFERDCDQCHNTENWRVPDQPEGFDHNETGYPLTGRHRQAACMDCHQQLIFNHVPHACVDCHTDIHRGELGFRCQNCHTPVSWENRREMFEAHQETDFPLIGVHALLDCRACHRNELRREFINASPECASCHAEDYAQSVNPDHKKAGFSSECTACHLIISMNWQQARYQHIETFPLENGHGGLDCIGCHETGYHTTSPVCYSCHRSDYDNTSDPAHRQFGFPTNCESCHSAITWTRSTFDHFQESGFALEGAHASRVLCIDCHVNNRLTGLARDCYGCHEQDYQDVQSPDHQAAQFPQTCLDCHNQNSWTPADFDHNQTNFPLTGAHRNADCGGCHGNGVFAGTPTDCFSCHETDYNGAGDPDHAANNFSHNCTDCHSTSAWEPADFDHNQTNFPLTGAHTSVACIDCHDQGYVNTPTDCFSCHETDYNGAGDPDHAANNFSHDCGECHSTAAWEPADYDHNNTDFPLTGAHVSVSCNECHSSGFSNTPIECVACHESDYNATTDPNHPAAGFPSDCRDCHSTSGWTPADFDHDTQYFPIYSGEHQGEWDACSDCHVDANQFARFECINCHEHRQSKMDDKHREVQDYAYNSAACFDCHPDGKGDD